MKTLRYYDPPDGELLYHYCDAEALLAICTSKKMRFSDIFSMNDFMEMHWGYRVWEKAASALIDTVGREFLDKIDEVFHNSGIFGLVVTSCFSLDGDVLSQWRAYADDGQGYAIGFNARDLIQLPTRPLRVLYDEDAQVQEVKKIVTTLHKVEKTADEQYGSDFREICHILAYDLAALKNPAFSEEKEVRLIHLLDFNKSNSSLRLTDAGGYAFGKESEGVSVQFRMKDNVPTPFIELDFTDNGNINPVKQVVMGPRNDALPSAISIFLETTGIGSVDVKKSKASYR